MISATKCVRGLSWVIVLAVTFCASALLARAEDAANEAMFAAHKSRAWTEAVKLARAQTEANPKNDDAWYVLGSSLQGQGDFDGALAAYAKLATSPQYADHSRMLTAVVQVKKGDAGAAIAALAELAATGYSSAQELRIQRDFDPIRGDARFAEVMQKVEENGRAAQARGERLMFSTETDRKSARLVLYGGVDTLRVVIDHGVVPWREGYGKAIDDPDFDGGRWRLGANDWTTLDTNVGLALGDIDVPAGEYGLTIRREPGGKAMLELHDMAQMRKQRIDPYYCQGLPIPALQLELDREDLDEPAANLAISMAPKKAGDGHVCELRIDFGPYRLSTPMVLQSK